MELVGHACPVYSLQQGKQEAQAVWQLLSMGLQADGNGDEEGPKRSQGIVWGLYPVVTNRQVAVSTNQD